MNRQRFCTVFLSLLFGSLLLGSLATGQGMKRLDSVPVILTSFSDSGSSGILLRPEEMAQLLFEFVERDPDFDLILQISPASGSEEQEQAASRLFDGIGLSGFYSLNNEKVSLQFNLLLPRAGKTQTLYYESIPLSQAARELHVELRKHISVITIDSSPAADGVILNELLVASQVPVVLSPVVEGTHKVQATLRGMRLEQQVQVPRDILVDFSFQSIAEGQPQPVSIATPTQTPPDAYGFIRVKSLRSGEVKLDGEFVGKSSSLSPIRLPVGEHQVELHSPGRAVKTRTVTVEKDKTHIIYF